MLVLTVDKTLPPLARVPGMHKSTLIIVLHKHYSGHASVSISISRVQLCPKEGITCQVCR